MIGEQVSRIAVLGSGAWGVTLSQILIDSGNEAIVWGRNKETVDEINNSHTNKRFLPGVNLPKNLKATTNVEVALKDVKMIVLAIPAQGLRANLKAWHSIYPLEIPTVSTLKGIEEKSCLRMSEVVKDELPIKDLQFAILTGPNLAGEISLRQPASAVAASINPELSELMIQTFTTNYFHMYPSNDVVGCELAGATKSVIALAVGIAVGLGLGGNTQSMIITRGLNEVARFGESYGSKHLTFLGLAGVGDLVVSCGSGLSRNRTFGEILGKLGTVEAARANFAKTVEGVASAPAIRELAHRVGVNVPIIEAVTDTVLGVITPKQCMERIMQIDSAIESL